MDWQLQKDLGWSESGRWSVKLNPRDPAQGVSLFFDQTLSWNLLRIRPIPGHALHLQEAYVRQEDLILRYEQSGNDLFGFQLNWRRVECDVKDALGLELWLSVQTTLLDTHPQFEIDSTAHGTWRTMSLGQLTAGQNGGAALGWSEDTGRSTLVMIQDSDVVQAKLLERGREQELAIRMFGQFLEKGVIRRARLGLLATSSPMSPDAIRTAYHRFCASPLPLTA